MGMEWDVDPMEFMGEVKASVKKVVEEVSIEIFAGVVMRTPVQSGNLRASWRISHTNPDLSISLGGSVDNPLPPPPIPRSIPGLPDFPLVIVSNNQSYAGYVEEGTPRMAPHYMVKLTLESLRS